jgi:hypothetical protein
MITETPEQREKRLIKKRKRWKEVGQPKRIAQRNIFNLKRPEADRDLKIAYYWDDKLPNALKFGYTSVYEYLKRRIEGNVFTMQEIAEDLGYMHSDAIVNIVRRSFPDIKLRRPRKEDNDVFYSRS